MPATSESGKFSARNSFFQFFPLRVKKDFIGLGQKYPGQRQFGPFFTVGQKYALVGLD